MLPRPFRCWLALAAIGLTPVPAVGERGERTEGMCTFPNRTGVILRCSAPTGSLHIWSLSLQVGAGNQAALYAVHPMSGDAHRRYVAKVGPGEAVQEQGSNCLAFTPDQECQRITKVIGAGVRTPACVAFECQVEGTSERAFVMDYVEGDVLVRSTQFTTQQFADAERNHDSSSGLPVPSSYLEAGETLAQLMNKAMVSSNVTDFENNLPREIYGFMFKMIKAGYANTDQHIDNMMLDKAGQIWFIDFGIAQGFVDVRGAKDLLPWSKAVAYMTRVVTRAVRSLTQVRDQELQPRGPRFDYNLVTSEVFNKELNASIGNNLPTRESMGATLKGICSQMRSLEIAACSAAASASIQLHYLH